MYIVGFGTCSLLLITENAVIVLRDASDFQVDAGVLFLL